MTREEAREELKEMIEYEWGTYFTNTAKKHVTALEMAIKALEQEPTTKIRAEIQKLRNCSCSCSDGIIDDIEDILDKYKVESEDK